MIGILAMEKASTEFYIQLFEEMCKKNGITETSKFKLVPTDFESINNLLPYRSPNLDTIISNYLKKMLTTEVEGILIPNITIHETVDAVVSTHQIKVPIIHPLLGTIKKMQLANNQKAVLFGSKYTMQSNYIKDVFAKSGILIQQPKIEDIQFIETVRKQVYAGNISTATLEKFNNLVAFYAVETTIILACTELSLASKSNNQCVLDMAKIQIEEAVAF